MEFPKFDDAKMMREAGTELVGTSGLNCIVCHTFQLREAANMPAVDLTEMAERLQKNWFYHYMQNPQSLSPNTIMPSFWPAGRALRNDILDGNSELHIEALWQYLLDGRQARTPRGLIVEPMELLAADQAVMLRRSYPSVGKRGIGVGYPLQLNLVFDAEQLRLALLWKGKFADPGGVWRSQGHGQVRPLGDHWLEFAPGPDLDVESEPWIVDDGRPPKHQFSGYALDAAQRPRFKYVFDGIQVEDYVVDQHDPVSGQPFLRRSVTFNTATERSGLAFRLAAGKAIRPSQDAAFTVDDQLQVQVHVHPLQSPPAGPRVAQQGEWQQLQLPLHLMPGATTITVDYRW